MILSSQYLLYSLFRPFHSAKHKSCKKAASRAAREKDLYARALAEVSQYSDEDPAAIESKNVELARQLNQQDFDRLAPAQLDEFYAGDRHYLYELPLWNAGSGRAYYFIKAVFPYLKKNRYRDILDFGAGSGDLCLALAEKGFNAFYTDINRILIDFSAWRFSLRGLKIPIIPAEELKRRTFDCVLSFDVFEHLKDLPEKVKEIAGLIRPGGSLVFNIEFSGEGLHLQENKRYADTRALDLILRQAGLRFQWRFKQHFFYKKP